MSYAQPPMGQRFALIGCVVVALASTADAQQGNVQIQTPIQILNDHYYEYTGSSWFLGGFNNGGFGPPPPFGGYAGGGSTFGFGGRGWGFNFLAAQGSSRSYVVQSPSVTMIPGTSGWFRDVTMRPFVTGIVPFVGTPRSTYGPTVAPPWNGVEVRDYVQRRRLERATQRQQEESEAVVGPAPTRQNDDPPLRLK